MINTRMTLSDLVRECPSRADVMDRLGLDYCCGGKQTLADACRAGKLDVRKISREIEVAGAGIAQGEVDWSTSKLGDLIDHIVGSHHEFVRRELEPLQARVEKIARVHGAIHPELLQVRDIFEGLRTEMEAHLEFEENVVFPRIKALETGAPGTDGFGSWLKDLEVDHEQIGGAFHDMSRLTGGYRVPADGCPTYHAAMKGLEALEKDTHRHVHKENNYLIPAALALASRRPR
jgi:regulator of cell morphogenesis and NO signaling